MRQPGGLKKHMSIFSAESLMQQEFQGFLGCLRLAQSLKYFLCKGFRVFIFSTVDKPGAETIVLDEIGANVPRKPNILRVLERAVETQLNPYQGLKLLIPLSYLVKPWYVETQLNPY